MTYFSALYPFIRTCVHDTGVVPLISAGTLDKYIAVALDYDFFWRTDSRLTLKYTEGAVDPVNGRTITPDWDSPLDRFIMYLEAAAVILGSELANTGHKVGRMEVKRAEPGGSLLRKVEAVLRDAKYGTFPIASANEWTGEFLLGTPNGISLILQYPG